MNSGSVSPGMFKIIRNRLKANQLYERWCSYLRALSSIRATLVSYGGLAGENRDRTREFPAHGKGWMSKLVIKYALETTEPYFPYPGFCFSHSNDFDRCLIGAQRVRHLSDELIIDERVDFKAGFIYILHILSANGRARNPCLINAADRLLCKELCMQSPPNSRCMSTFPFSRFVLPWPQFLSHSHFISLSVNR